METETHQSYSWWNDSHKRSKRSPWLLSSLTELENKSKMMMKLIEVEGDSFKKRVEIYYETRPQLILLIEDLYRSHRSLIEQYDKLTMNQNLVDPVSDSPSSSSNSSQVATSYEEFTAKSAAGNGSCHDVNDQPEVLIMREELENLRKENARLRDELTSQNKGKKSGWLFSFIKYFKLRRK